MNAAEVFKICLSNNESEVLKMITSDPTCVNVQDEYSYTPLHELCSTDLTNIAQLLIDNGANINSVNDEGITPLHIVNSLEMAELLIKNGADIDAIDNEGCSPLIRLAMEPSDYLVDFDYIAEIMEHLLKLGAKPDFKNTFGDTALSLSAGIKNRELMIKTFISNT